MFVKEKLVSMKGHRFHLQLYKTFLTKLLTFSREIVFPQDENVMLFLQEKYINNKHAIMFELGT